MVRTVTYVDEMESWKQRLIVHPTVLAISCLFGDTRSELWLVSSLALSSNFKVNVLSAIDATEHSWAF